MTLAFPKPVRRRKAPKPLRTATPVNAKRIAAKAAGTLTEDEWLRICAAYRYGCGYQGKHAGRITQDHIIAIAHGGAHTADNVVPACERHQQEKGTQTWEPRPGHPFRKEER